MAHDVVKQIMADGEYFAEHATEAEDLGRLPDETAKRMREIGVIRMLQPTDFGGYEADPREYFEAVMALASRCPASGWVSGIVGVHPWELAICDRRVQEEVWGSDPDTWIASPYAPIGRGKPVDGGFLLRGRWPFSSGTDHCDWAFLGGIVAQDDWSPAKPTDVRHFILPRSDYRIIEGSWDVVGLRGTGSKDVVVEDAFIPSYRAMEATKVVDGRATKEAGRTTPLYRTPWSAIFPNAITAAIIGIAEGALAAHVDYQKGRVDVRGRHAVASDPWALAAIADAASEIHACRAQLLTNVGAMYEMALRGEVVPMSLRGAGRRDQVRSSWRAVRAVDEIFARSGGSALRMDKPLQRLWRDAHAGLNHGINIHGPIFQAFAQIEMGQQPEGLAGLTI